MLTRPEIDTKEHILLWLASKDPNEKYVWDKGLVCPCGQYSLEHHGNQFWWVGQKALTSIRALNGLAFDSPRTFGALYERARMAWKNPGNCSTDLPRIKP